MYVERLELVDFRNYERATFELNPGVTAIVGRNAQGKTNVAESMAFLATLESFRNVPPAVLIREIFLFLLVEKERVLKKHFLF